MNDEMTPAKAEALAKLSADLLQVMFNTAHANPELRWTDMVIAATVAMRGLAARACKENPTMPPFLTRTMLKVSFDMGMNMPDEVVRAVPGDDEDGPDTASIIPVRTH